MSTDQGPEATTDDPEAPFGRRPNGAPYKRDPSAFAHLRGRPFGSLNGQTPPSRRERRAAGKARPRAAINTTPLAHDAEGYAAKFKRGFRGMAKMLSRKAPVPAAIVAVRSQDMADAWGRVAVTYPGFGRLVDKFSKGTDLSNAVGSTLTTLMMVAHVGGYTKGLWFADLIEDAVNEAMNTFAESPEFAGQAAAFFREAAPTDAVVAA